MIPELIASYGYLAIMLGTLAEGETALICGGYAAQCGWLDLTPALVAAFAGAYLGDQLFFWIGRRHGRSFFAKRPQWQARVERLNGLLQRHETVAVIGFRFLYGLRVATPMALGMAGVRYARYLVLTTISGVVWTLSFGLGGYYLGEAMTRMMDDVEQLQLYGLGGILVMAALVLLIRSIRRKRGHST